MKNFIYALISLMVFNFCKAQSDINSTGYTYTTQFLNMTRELAVSDTRLSDNPDLINAVKQSQLFDLNWEQAEIKVNENSTLVQARYNPFNDAIEIKQDDKIFEFAKRINREIKFIDTDITYQAKSFFGSDDKIYTSYFMVNSLADDTTILKKEWFEENPSYGKTIQKYPSVVTDKEKFKKRDYYYFIDDNNRLFHLTMNPSEIKELFPDNSTSIIKYIKANKLSSKNEKDIITLATYINTLKIESEGS